MPRMVSGALRRVGERVVRAIAARLSPERGEALLMAGRGGYALLTGRRTRKATPQRREPRVSPLAVRRIEIAIERLDLPLAVTLADKLLERHPESTRVLRLQRDALARMGAVSTRARVLHRLHRIDDQPEWWAAERGLVGRLTETTPGWLPWVPGPRHSIEPAGDDVVLHLLKESSPHLTTGFTMRSRYNLLAAAAAGVRPVVVTALGFPRILGVDPVAPLELVDDIPHHRLDLGPSYPLDRPADQLLEDQAWLIARIAREVRPALIHASSGHRGYEFALVGAALRAHLDRPLVYEVRSFFESTWAGDDAWAEVGEQYQRRHDTETRTMLAADHVITIGEAMRRDIIDRGIDPERITIIPNGVDVEVFSPEPPDPALRARYGLEGRFAFGYVSNLDHPRENQELLIDATRILLQRGRQVRCLIIGGGKRADELKRHARQAGVGDAVVFTGRIPHDEVRGHYALLDAFVVPRRDERAARMVTPLKPFEAMAMACPLIVADLPALLEIAEPEERGLSFTTGDARGLAAALERLIDDPALGDRIGQAGREWVARERAWSANGPRLREVYGAVLAAWAARPRQAG